MTHSIYSKELCNRPRHLCSTEKGKDKESLKKSEDYKRDGEYHLQGVSDGKSSKHPGESRHTSLGAPQPNYKHNQGVWFIGILSILAIVNFPLSCTADVMKLDKSDANGHDDTH